MKKILRPISRYLKKIDTKVFSFHKLCVNGKVI